MDEAEQIVQKGASNTKKSIPAPTAKEHIVSRSNAVISDHLQDKKEALAIFVENKKRKIEDVGPKIGGARKDLARQTLSVSMTEQMNEAEKASLIKKNNIWKSAPNKTLYENGCNPFVTLFVSDVKRMLPSAPFDKDMVPKDKEAAESIRRAYIEYISFMRDTLTATYEMETLEEARAYVREQMTGKYVEPVLTKDGYTVYVFTEEGETVNAFNGFSAPKSREGEPGAVLDAVFNPHLADISGKYNKEWDEILDRSISQTQKKTESIETLIKKAQYLEHVKRDGGKEWREHGRSITEKELLETFSLRAIEFGNYVTQEERQIILNNAYDSFMDMCDVLGLDEKAIGFDGRLAIGFGSRGKGRAKAHYEPDRAVINLTKTQGAGSFAHEWFHALDNHLMAAYTDTDITTSMASSKFKQYMEEHPGTQDVGKGGIFDTLSMLENTKHVLMFKDFEHTISNETERQGSWRASSFIEYENTIASKRIRKEREINKMRVFMVETSKIIGERTDFYKSAQTLDEGRSGKKRYFSKPEEMLARAFEIYVFDKLKKAGITNDYLVARTKGDDTVIEKLLISRGIRDASPYPRGMEREKFSLFFDTLMESMKQSSILSADIRPDRVDENGIETVKIFEVNEKLKVAMEKDTLVDGGLKYKVCTIGGNGKKRYYAKISNAYHHTLMDAERVFCSVKASAQEAVLKINGKRIHGEKP